MSLAAESCRSRTVATSAETLWERVERIPLCDSRRLRKKPQDAQDDVTELFDFFDA